MKKFIAVLFLFLLLVPTQVFAHSKMTESSPEADATITQSPEKITIAFNTTIASMSTFQLLNEQQEEQAVSNIEAKDHELIGEVTTPLQNGVYTVQYQIIGADGHAIDGSYQFTVNAEEVAPTTEPTTEPSTEPSNDSEGNTEPTAEPTVEPSVSDAPDQNAVSTEKDSNNTWIFVVIGIIIILIIVFAMRKRK